MIRNPGSLVLELVNHLMRKEIEEQALGHGLIAERNPRACTYCVKVCPAILKQGNGEDWLAQARGENLLVEDSVPVCQQGRGRG